MIDDGNFKSQISNLKFEIQPCPLPRQINAHASPKRMQPSQRREEPTSSQPLVRRRPNRPGDLSDADDLALRNAYLYGQPADDELDLREFLRKLRRHKWMLATVVVVITTLAAIIMLRAKSTYTATTVLEIGKESSTVVKASDLTLENEDSDLTMMTNIKTKMVMLKSQELLEDVIINLKLEENQKFREAMEGGKSWRQIFGVKKTAPQVSEETAELLRHNAAAANVRSPEERLRLSPFVEALEDNLSVEQIKDTRALKISYTHNSPELAAAVADGIAQSFIQRSYHSKTERFTNTQAWLERSTAELKAKVEKAEQSLANYTRENQIFSTEGRSTLTTERLAQLHDQATRAETDRMLKETLYDQVKQGRVAQLPEAFAELTARQGGTDPKIILLQKRQDELEAGYAKLAVKLGPDNPQLKEVQQQIAAVKSQIEEGRRSLEAKLGVEYERAVRDEQSLKYALARAKAEAVSENQAAIFYNILKQDVETAKSLYTEFLNKANQSRIKLAEQYSSIRVLDHAKIPIVPSGPKRTLIILACFVASLVLGIGLVLLREFLDNTIKSVEDVSRTSGLATLAIIPDFSVTESVSPIEWFRQRRELRDWAGMAKLPESRPGFQSVSSQKNSLVSAASEAYLNLRTSVLLSTAGGPPKTILMTSGEPGDGKSTTVINTAISLAQVGASVVVIDADLRRPSLHRMVGADNKKGLSTYLSGKAMLADLIQPLPVPNLFLLPSGPTPPNPTNLLSSTKMQKALEILSEHYDYVLIDSPPLLNIADAVVLSTLADGVVIVVRGSKSTHDLLRRAKFDLSGVGANIIGVVLNSVDLRRDGYSHYNHYKYYRY
jgi:polysaccharide biosynthesis transport protein